MAAGAAKRQPAQSKGSKSGLIALAQGQDLFKEGDAADCLYIIQKGQLRLYKPKGKGFVELAVLRSGEVLGEMAYFGEGADSRRSCSAAAIVKTEVIAISFSALEKALLNLNPWFRTIVTTLADRLRKTNAKVKALESNNVGGGYGSAGHYAFLKDAEIVKILTVLYLVGKSFGEKRDDGPSHTLSKKIFKFYAGDIFAISEAKYEEFFTLLKETGYLEIANDDDGLPNLMSMPDIEKVKELFMFINTQRNSKDNEKIRVSAKCETLMDHIVDTVKNKGLKGPKCNVPMTPTLNYFKERNVAIDISDLEEAREFGFVGDILVGEGNVLSVEVNIEKFDSTFSCVKFSNALRKFNDAHNK
ncbi:MAG: cyclic nucleotide-binding domain-containing protein [Bacteriovoracaceae bacterium]|jgi:CRP/FNR family transcriptional regulator, cyclic AMP receptor protein|nr:cyclic nucleotide-binding domain-containing protein [Bacteriovoracaceae bacterium]